MCRIGITTDSRPRAEQGKVMSSVAFMNRHALLGKEDIQDPMQRVFHFPMRSNVRGNFGCAGGLTTDQTMRLSGLHAFERTTAVHTSGYAGRSSPLESTRVHARLTLKGIPIPDAGWLTALDREWEQIVRAEYAQLFGSAKQGALARVGRLYECPECHRLMWQKSGEQFFPLISSSRYECINPSLKRTSANSSFNATELQR